MVFPSSIVQEQNQYEEMLRGFSYIVAAELVPALAIYDRLNRALIVDHDDLIEAEPLLHYLHKSLELDVFLTFSKLLDGHRSERNIIKFVNFCDANQKKIVLGNASATTNQSTMKELVVKHQKMLAERQDTIVRLTSRRDKYLAHSDKKYFLNLTKLDEDFPVSTKDLVDLVQCFQKIVNDHSMALESKAALSIHDFVYAATEKFLGKVAPLKAIHKA